MDRLWQDLRFAMRALRKSPGFTAVAVLSLGLGIGANTAIFSLIHSLILRALPVEDPRELVLLSDPASGGVAAETREGGERSLFAWQEFDALRKTNTVFSGMFAVQSSPARVDARIGQVRLNVREQLASGEFFQVLGLRPALGRFFTSEEDRIGADHPVAVISYGFWQRQFAGDAGVLGKTLLIGRGSFHIAGVAPPGFRGVVVGTDVDAWLPLTIQPQALPGHDYLTPLDTLWLQMMARLKPGVARETAQAGVNVTFQQLLQGWSGSLPDEKERKEMLDQKIVLRAGAQGASIARGQFGDPLVVLMAMVGIVLLIACANIANLTLARATGRERELGVRMALGARRGALVRQILAESLLIAAAGGLAGSLLAVWGADAVMALVAGSTFGIVLDGRQEPGVWAFTAGVSLVTILLFGLAPALRATRVDVNRLLAAGVRGAIASRRSARGGRMLVAAQIALSLLLLIGAAVLVRSLNRLAGQNLGYDRDHLIMTSVDPRAAGYEGAAAEDLYRRLAERARLIPGVQSVAVSDYGMFGGESRDPIAVEGFHPADGHEVHAYWTLIGAGYFRTVGIPLLRGRELNEADEQRRLPVCVINHSLARFLFNDGDPIGKHLTDEYPTTRTTYEIVGVVADARERSLRRDDRRFYGNIYHPISRLEQVTFVLRTWGDPAKAAGAVRAAVNSVDPAVPVLLIRTINEQIGRRLLVERLTAQLAGCFGVLALLMAAVGIYGVMSYAIGRRTSEIGLRMALGASQRGVLKMVLRETAMLLAAGLAAGLPCAIAAVRLLGSTLPGISPTDPMAIGTAILIITAATLLAGYIPARRASRIDPMEALRCE